MRFNSHGDLYPFFTNSGVQALLTVVGSDVWHRRLGHPSDKTISTLARFFLPTCNKDMSQNTVCMACQLGKQLRLPFSNSKSFTTAPFQ
uniref:GAG-pre-integrase domain-containing protein n=1 Tax=Triticum urartu TaxID=4572 RepID=A0A8R7PNP1_TRIUA